MPIVSFTDLAIVRAVLDTFLESTQLLYIVSCHHFRICPVAWSHLCLQPSAMNFFILLNSFSYKHEIHCVVYADYYYVFLLGNFLPVVFYVVSHK
jgi:hypothetical protein